MSLSTPSRNKIALGAICLSALMLGLEIPSVPSILPILQHVLPASFRQLEWIANAYTLAMTVSLMATGALADRFGRKRVFMLGIAVFGVASLACGVAQSAPVLIAMRFAQGASAAVMLACQIAVLSHQFREGDQRRIAFGWWGIVFGAGLGFGPLIGTLTAVLTSWNWVFLAHVVLAGITWGLARAGITESANPHATSVDLPGMATLSLAIFSVVYLIIAGEGIGPANLQGLALAGIGLASLVAFVIIESTTAQPTFEFRVFRVRALSGALFGSAGMNFSFWPLVVYLPIYCQSALGLSAPAVGAMLLAYTIPPLVVPPLAERLLVRAGARVVIPLGLFTIGAGFQLIRLGVVHGSASWATILPGCVIAGIGLGLTNTTVTNTTTGALPPEQAGMAAGLDTSARIISLAINIAVMGAILVHGIGASLDAALPHGAPAGLADAVAAGDVSGVALATARAALAQGFAAVTLYGAVCAWVLSALSFVTFGRGSATLAAGSPQDGTPPAECYLGLND